MVAFSFLLKESNLWPWHHSQHRLPKIKIKGICLFLSSLKKKKIMCFVGSLSEQCILFQKFQLTMAYLPKHKESLSFISSFYWNYPLPPQAHSYRSPWFSLILSRWMSSCFLSVNSETGITVSHNNNFYVCKCDMCMCMHIYVCICVSCICMHACVLM
jgi:hypothetical protein